MSTGDADAAGTKPKQAFVKPERPDQDKYNQDLAKAEKEHSTAQEKLNALKAKIDLAKPNNKDSPSGKRRAELIAQLQSIRQQQQGNKSSRSAVHEKIRRLDEQLKSKINELKTARSRIPYKSVADVDREIERLQKQVDTGTMKLVDEKKALTEITNLHKQKKGFTGFDDQERFISEIRAQISDLKKSLDDPEQRALSDKYTELQKELDELKSEQDEAFKNLNALRDERSKAQAEQQEKYTAMKQIKDQYYQSKRAFADYEHQAYKARQERKKAERDAYEANKRRHIADQKLEEASQPAYSDEIMTAEGLLRYFDPSSVATKEASGPGKFAATAQRTVDESGLKGTRLARKDEGEENYFMGTGGKKGKKGKKGGATSSATAPSDQKFNLSIGVIEELNKIHLEPPMNQADVPSVVSKLKENVEFWKKDQARKTRENIAKAQKEIEKLSETSSGTDDRSKDAGNKPSAANQGVDGKKISAERELAQEEDAAADAAEELEKAKLEDAAV